ncbi:sporulation protein [Intestinimonas massiliensis (ex Afouda et al. 2020)]|uniref:sporulation protein n=1 Tax=Intestinimonas massiliensis (ex Afouda et al. 2020) TaxID=1673721 RepID=UPI0010319D54|nr:sporulation protein [Intestinimonas massiliensis (ex Afouda et al. 2020)]
MEWLSLLGAAAVFAAACNLDTVLLAMGWAVRGVRPGRAQRLVIAGLTTLITWLSLALGKQAAAAGVVAPLGGLVLVGMGLWCVLDWLRAAGGPEAAPNARGSSLWDWVALAAALAVNNAGMGVAAGVSGVSPGLAALANLVCTLAALPLGRALGDGLAGRLLGRFALPLSGVLLVALGVWEILNP